MNTSLERISSDLSPVKVIGAVPCPNEGCKGKGRKVELFGMVVVEACEACQARADARIDAEERAELTSARLRNAGATPTYMDWTLDSYPTDEIGTAAVKFAKDWLADYRSGVRKNVVLFGPQGSGKTGLAWSMIRELIEVDGVGARIRAWQTTLDVLRASAKTNSEEAKLEAENLRRAPVLVLDDVGREKPTDFACAELLSLIDHRMLYKRPTIFTSNLDLDALADRLGWSDPIIGRRIVSRMAGGARQYEVVTDDRRLAA